MGGSHDPILIVARGVGVAAGVPVAAAVFDAVSGGDARVEVVTPDGTRVVYYETFIVTESSFYNDHTGDLVMVNVDGSGAHQRDQV